MADVRGASGAPAGAAFGGVSSPTPSTPLYVDLATGDLYVLISNVVTKVGSISADSNLVVTQQVFGKHFERPVEVADSNAEMATRSFAIRQMQHSDIADSNQQMAARTFGYRAPIPAAVLGDASTLIQQRSFAPRPLPAMWS